MANLPLPENLLWLAAATVCSTADAVWNERASAYLRLRALSEAESDFGRLYEATEANGFAAIRAESEVGPTYLTHPKTAPAMKVERDKLQAVEQAWTEQFCKPMWAAARLLVQTPAPTLAAALFKIEVIRRDEMWCDGLDFDLMDTVAADLKAGAA